MKRKKKGKEKEFYSNLDDSMQGTIFNKNLIQKAKKRNTKKKREKYTCTYTSAVSCLSVRAHDHAHLYICYVYIQYTSKNSQVSPTVDDAAADGARRGREVLGVVMSRVVRTGVEAEV